MVGTNLIVGEATSHLRAVVKWLRKSKKPYSWSSSMLNKDQRIT